MDLNSHISGDKIKWTVVFLLCVAFLACIIALFVRINRVDTTKDLSATAYTVGTLTTSGGTETESDHALRTDLLKVEDFICIKVDEDSDLTYKVFYYDEDHDFISVSASSSSNLTSITTNNAVYYRVVIEVPSSMDDVSLLNKVNYVSQITVTVNR